MDRQNIKEKIRHGDAGFPLCVYRNDLRYNEHVLYYHWHNEMEFIYMLEGNAVFQVDATPVELHTGQAVFISSGAVHSGNSLDGSHCLYYAIVFDPWMLCRDSRDICFINYLKPMVEEQETLPRLIIGASELEKDILSQLRSIIGAFESSTTGYELEIKACLYNVFYRFAIWRESSSVEKHGNQLNRFKADRLKTILNYIESNYTREIGIKDMAREINISNYYFCRFFKQYMGMSPVDYVNYCRINMAVKLLQERDGKIIDIALDVGFKNLSYFIKTFKKYKKCTPGEYRKLSI